MKEVFSLLILLISAAVAFAEKGTVLDDRVRVRSAPSLKYSTVVGVVNKGEKLEVDAKTEETDNIDGFSEPWYRIKFNDEERWIYGGYFSVDSSIEYLSEVNKTRAMSEALFMYNVKYVMYCGEYLKKGKNIKKSRRSFNVEGGYVENASCYIYEYGPVKIDCYTSNGSNFIWNSTTIIKNTENPLNIKLCMTMEEVKEVFGDFDSVRGDTAYIYGGGVRAEFVFEKNMLDYIIFANDGC